MEHLPDDVLAMVMQYLGVHDLLACRLVSKRVGALALHPDAWRHRRLGLGSARDFDINFDDNRCLCPVLRLAPCVAVLARYLTRRHLPCRLADDSMRCAAEEIWINVRKDISSDVFELIRRQGELGRLKVISMNLIGDAPVAAAMEAVLSVKGLKGLKVMTIRLPGRELDEIPAMATPSLHTLKHFDFRLGPESERFVNSILSEHATTIEKVALDGYLSSDLSLTSTAPLLATMTRLRELRCPALPGLEAVAACESLRTLRLSVCSETLSYDEYKLSHKHDSPILVLFVTASH
ncbi:uncharacterized protein LOC127751032 [Frankliniella occidentalis]|uniref:Uncharacterized protein LOC127751032 n=1 Tax=Frankliniella occidentalis TaxID=133901 RepID=A0A9C6XSR0_FRAOC|nr:uncharacterized protein LOC127751032 [Frankliniella occidentalis]